MIGTNLRGISALTWHRIYIAGLVAFFVALALTTVGVLASPQAASSGSDPAGAASVIVLLFGGILIGTIAAFAQSARAITEASAGYTTLPSLAACGLELRRSRDGVILRPRDPRPRMTSTRKEQIAKSRKAMQQGTGRTGAVADSDSSGGSAGPSVRRGLRITSAVSIVALCVSVAIFMARSASGLSSNQGAAGLLDVLLIIGVLVAATLGLAALLTGRALRQVKAIQAEAPDAKVIGTMRTIELQAVVGVLNPGTVLTYFLYLTVDAGGLRLWGGSSPQVLWRLDAPAVIAVTVERATQGARTWDTMLLLFTDATDRVWPASFFLRRLNRPWILASGAFVRDAVASAVTLWQVPELPPEASASD